MRLKPAELNAIRLNVRSFDPDAVSYICMVPGLMMPGAAVTLTCSSKPLTKPSNPFTKLLAKESGCEYRAKYVPPDPMKIIDVLDQDHSIPLHSGAAVEGSQRYRRSHALI